MQNFVTCVNANLRKEARRISYMYSKHYYSFYAIVHKRVPGICLMRTGRYAQFVRYNEFGDTVVYRAYLGRNGAA